MNDVMHVSESQVVMHNRPMLANTALECSPLQVNQAHHFFSRALGLLCRKKISYDEALWIRRCSAVHTFGMRYAIAVFFLDQHHNVIAVIPALKPCRFARVPQARSVVEMLAFEPSQAEHQILRLKAALLF